MGALISQGEKLMLFASCVLSLFSRILCGGESSMAADDTRLIMTSPQVKAKAAPEVRVKESVVILHNQRFRRIEIRGETFFLQLQELDPGNNPGDPNRLLDHDNVASGRRECLRTNAPMDELDARVVGEVKITKVTSLYLEGLHNQCESFSPLVETDGHAGVKVRTGERSNIKLGFGASRLLQNSQSPLVPLPKHKNDLPTTTHVGPEVKFNLGF